MAKYKIIKNLPTKYGSIPEGTIVEGTKKVVEGRNVPLNIKNTSAGSVNKKSEVITITYKGNKIDISASNNRIELVTEPTNTTLPNQENGSNVKANQRGVIIMWAILGGIAYFKWNKSKNWRIGISVFAALNAYNTYKYFIKKDSSNISVNGSGSSKIDGIVKNYSLNSVGGGALTKEQEVAFKKHLSTLNSNDIILWDKISKIKYPGNLTEKQKIDLLQKNGVSQSDLARLMNNLFESIYKK
jgi:hypothetical protein